MKTILDIRGLVVEYTLSHGILSRILGRVPKVRAVDNVNLSIHEGEILCLVGESGCGKTSLAKAITALVKPANGEIIYEDRDIAKLSKKQMKRVRREIQMIFQDPYESLNSQMKVREIVAEPLKVHGLYNSSSQELIRQALAEVGLEPPESFLNKYPIQLSGGERQRVALASALILRPRIIVADEPVSMLDASTSASVLKLFTKLKEKYGITFLFITHNLAIARVIADRAAVMYRGKIIEIAPANEMIKRPKHPYTKRLIESIPTITPSRKRNQQHIQRPPTLKGCVYYSTCPLADDRCKVEEPVLREITVERLVACHYSEML